MRRPFFVLGLILLTCLARAAPVWLEEHSDLAPDPTLRRGTLPNGLRYVVRPNAEPRGRVSLRLLVAVGSLHERDDERGLAHFVEHMAFRGTRHYPNGAMAAELQRLGIAFGPDNTAFTFFDHTIYQLELPDATEATLRHGLTIFREYASEVSFDPELIERERGVVLAEKATRDTPDARVSNMNLRFLWPKSRQILRAPIGTEACVREFTRDQFVSFYDAWYRPERLAVIVVGDVAPEMAERLVAEVMTPLAARGPAREAPETFVPETASNSDVAIFADPGLIGASCVLEHPFADPRVEDTHAHRVQLLQRALAFTMFQRRVVKAAAAANGASISPSASCSSWLPGWSVATFGTTGRISNWREFIYSVEQQHRRAFLHGFTTEELHAAKVAIATSYAEAVKTSSTWPSDWIATRLADTLLEGSVFATPAALQRDLAADLEAATKAQCLAEFRRVWSTRAPHVFIATHPEFKVKATEIAAALNASRLVDVAALPEARPVEFAYTDFGPASPPTHESHIADLDIHQAEFANGVRLNFKATDFEADTVNLCVRVGRGKLSQPADKPGLDLLANLMVPRGGLKRHPYEEIEDLLNGHTISIGFSANSDAFEFTARCARNDVLLCLQVITAHLTDAAYRPEARRQVDAAFGTMYANLAASPGGPIAVWSQRVLTGGDRRFGVPAPEELMGRTIEELTAWVEPELKQGPIELSIVGDAAWDDATAAVARTFAALPARRPISDRRSDSVHAVKPAQSMYVFTTPPQLQQVAIAWYCPVPDLADIRQERRCRLLAGVISERLRVRLRDELGAAYSCSADFYQFEGLPTFSYFSIYAEVAPRVAQQAARLMKDELERLRKKKLTDDEFERARQPFIRHREEDLRNNGYWAYTVLRDAQEHPHRLADARDRSADTAAITRHELEKLAGRYFDPKKCFQFVAYPNTRAAANLGMGR